MYGILPCTFNIKNSTVNITTAYHLAPKQPSSPSTKELHGLGKAPMVLHLSLCQLTKRFPRMVTMLKKTSNRKRNACSNSGASSSIDELPTRQPVALDSAESHMTNFFCYSVERDRLFHIFRRRLLVMLSSFDWTLLIRIFPPWLMSGHSLLLTWVLSIWKWQMIGELILWMPQHLCSEWQRHSVPSNYWRPVEPIESQPRIKNDFY